MREFQTEQKALFYSIFAKIIPLTNDSIVKSTIFRETYCTSANLNRADLKLNKIEFKFNFNAIR